MAVAQGEALLAGVAAQEERERLNILVDERSCCASIVRRLRILQGRAHPLIRVRPVVHSISDDEDDVVDYDLMQRADKVANRSLFKSREEASGGVDLVRRKTAIKYQQLAAQRQVDWSTFENRMRDLRREFDRTGDEKLLDVIGSLKRPMSAANDIRIQSASASPCRSNACSPTNPRTTREADEVGSSPTGGERCASGSMPAAAEDMDPAALQLFKNEGFIRSTVRMEEHSCRVVLSRRWADSLVNPDEEILAHRRTVAANLLELARRDEEHEAAVQKAAETEFISTTQRFRVIAAAQNHRAQMSKEHREERMHMCEAEQRERWLVLHQEHEEFTTGIYIRRSNTVVLATKCEEEVHRTLLEARETEALEALHAGLAAMIRMIRVLLQHHGSASALFDHHRSQVFGSIDATSSFRAADVHDEGSVTDPDTFNLAARPAAIASAARVAGCVMSADALYLQLIRTPKAKNKEGGTSYL